MKIQSVVKTSQHIFVVIEDYPEEIKLVRKQFESWLSINDRFPFNYWIESETIETDVHDFLIEKYGEDYFHPKKILDDYDIFN